MAGALDGRAVGAAGNRSPLYQQRLLSAHQHHGHVAEAVRP
jgi:hypothetical protein